MKIGHTLKGSGPEKILFLHDWLGDSDNYRHITPFFDNQMFTLALMDLRGHGKSRNVSGEYNVQETMLDAFGLVKDLGWSHYHIVAHSLSTLVVQKMFMEFEGREKILSCIFFSPILPTGLPIHEKAYFSIRKIFHDYYLQRFGQHEYQNMLHSMPSALASHELNMSYWFKLEIQVDQDIIHPKALRGNLTMFMENLVRDKKMSYFPPLLVLTGEKDEGVFSPQFIKDKFFEYYDRFDLEVIYDAGHFFMISHAGDVFKKVQKFLKAHSRYLPYSKLAANG
jgi:pimeloyl-ACP methyl ester carboxylesterase